MINKSQVRESAEWTHSNAGIRWVSNFDLQYERVTPTPYSYSLLVWSFERLVSTLSGYLFLVWNADVSLALGKQLNMFITDSPFQCIISMKSTIFIIMGGNYNFISSILASCSSKNNSNNLKCTVKINKKE